MRRSGRSFNPPILVTGFLVGATVWTENPNVRRSSAKADAGSQSAKPSKMNTHAVRLFMNVRSPLLSLMSCETEYAPRSENFAYCLIRLGDGPLGKNTTQVNSEETAIVGPAG